MSTAEHIRQVTGELGRTLAAIGPEDAERLVDLILGARRVFLAGAGRSGLAVKAFAMRLNGLLASPSFGAWMTGPALDIETMLHGRSGAPRCAIVTTAHLGDEERQFVTTLVLSKLVTWMRRQSGTTDLRALLYMDEVAGYLPPTAMPPTKKPIMTLMKQARAFGVGVVLSTQNPVDVDYKALSNAGTWMIGRLQTDRDKMRLLDGMSAASGGVDITAVGDTDHEFSIMSVSKPFLFALICQEIGPSDARAKLGANALQ